MAVFRCEGCREQRVVRAQTPNQKFCSEKQCQRDRKSIWEKKRRQNDPDYRANDQDSRRAWKKENSGYYKNYRLTHPQYTSSNREKQRLRSQKKRDAQSLGEAKQLANVDASTPEHTEKRDVMLALVAGIANVDASISQLSEHIRLIQASVSPKDLANEDSWMTLTDLKRSG